MTMKYPKLMAVLCLFLILAASTFNIQQASMVDGWAGMDTTVHPSTDGDACTEQSIEVNSSYYQITETQNACVTYGKDIDLASRYFYTEDGVYAHVGVRYKGEDTFVPIWLPGYIYLIPGTNTFIYDSLYYGARSNAIFILENANNALQPQHSGSDYIYRYTLNENGRKLVFPAPQSNPWYKSSYRVSQDGRYIVANFTERGLFKADIKTGVVTKLLNSSGYGQNWHNNNYVKAVSNDGRFVFLGNSGLIVDTKDCGSRIHSVDAYSDPDVFVTNVCTTRDISSGIELMMPLGQLYYGINKAYFIASSNKLVFDAQMWWTYSSEQQWRMVELPPPSQDTSSEPKMLSYLALGDSYSSGEGDNGIFLGKKYYREGTDENGPPREKCHISTRSYPYLLANTQGLEKNDWNVVACSGALVEKDYHGNSTGYLGQGGRLSDLGSRLSQYRADAKNEFIPGRVQQIEFVKKYKPKVITLTGTGNDADFAPILKACVSASLLERVTEETCTYAADSRGISMLGTGISRQYDNVRSLVRAIKQESPQTTIYYVGYPQFLKETDKTCGLGVSLSKQERRVFRTAVVYLNSIIKAAAESEGAVYVDIESSLGSHLLCGDDPYVTGYNADCSKTPLNWFKGKDECEESFHPRPAGHALMASTILANHPNIMQDQPCAPPRSCTNERSIEDVEVPKLFKDAYNQDAKANHVPVRGGSELAAQKGNTDANIYATASHAAANSKFDTYVTSNPVSLGEIWSDPVGNLVIDKAVPESLPAGYHTLHAEGNDSSGKPIELWWIIRIFGKDGDVDEDGIPDDTDKCMFMPTLNIDEDNDGIDDGCDSDIGGSGQWTKYTPSLRSDAATMSNSRSHNELPTVSAPEDFADSNKSWTQSAVGKGGSAKLSGSKSDKASKSTISMILVGVGLLSVLFIAYTIIRKGGINGKKATNQ